MMGSLPVCVECKINEGGWTVEGVGDICNGCMVLRTVKNLRGFVSIKRMSISYLYTFCFGKDPQKIMREPQLRVLCKAIEIVLIEKEGELIEGKR